MRKLLYLIPLLLLSSCFNLQEEATINENNSYKLIELSIILSSSEIQTLNPFEGVEVRLSELNSGIEYRSICDASGMAQFNLPLGVYRATVNSLIDGERFGASKSGVILNKSQSIILPLTHIETGDLLIKEIYCGGCSKYPQEGTYDYDGYFIIHNNTFDIQYLDGLCVGCADPYNSNATVVWEEDEIKEFVPIIQALWMFSGDGKSFPLLPGEDAVVALKEAINHRETYPLSVDLNKPGYFVAYNKEFFPGNNSHTLAVPGSNIASNHILECVIKMGQANMYTVSKSSPALVIFKAVDTSIKDFLEKEGTIIQKPGTQIDRIMKVPVDWIMDGVEVFNGQSTNNKKRLSAVIDASNIVLSNTNEGKSLMRKVDEENSKVSGIEILVDTNSSSNDFVELNEASLRNEN